MEQISFKEFVETILRKWRIMIVAMAIAMALGVIMYAISPDEYTSSVALSVESGSSQSGLGTLANLAGFDLQLSENEGLGPVLYQYIIESAPYLYDVVNRKIAFEADSVYLKDYLINRMIVSIPGKLDAVLGSRHNNPLPKPEGHNSGWLQTDSSNGDPLFRRLEVLHVGGNDRKAMNILSRQITYTTDNIINIEVVLQHPDVTAQVAGILVEALADYVHEYGQDKGYQRLAFIEEQLNRAREKLYSAQGALAKAKDSSRNLMSSMGQVKLERLNMEYQLAYSMYNSLAQQMENSRIKIEEDKPVFLVIEPPMLSATPSAPRLAIFVIFSVLAGGILGISWIYLSAFLRRNL